VEKEEREVKEEKEGILFLFLSKKQVKEEERDTHKKSVERT